MLSLSLSLSPLPSPLSPLLSFSGIRRTYGDEVVIIGGVGHDRLFIEGMVKRARVVAFFISGENFCAYTRQLNTTDNADFYTPAHELLEEVSMGPYSPVFTFLFTSRFVHRGQAYYSSAHSAFRQTLAPTPILGFYSYGEYCLSERDIGQKSVTECKRYMKYNSAILCVCCYGRPGNAR